VSVQVRRMLWEDIEQVREIDLRCFPTMLPPTNYQTEFVNPMAHYLVAYDSSAMLVEKTDSVKRQSVLGFIGLWFMASEVHILSLAVHPNYRCQGVGEVLLIHGIELSKDLKAILMTLEVRASNMIAQKLYSKYGFTERGVRRSYYLDNGENAVIMTLDRLYSSEYETLFGILKKGCNQNKESPLR